jgi:hypothetical protein
VAGDAATATSSLRRAESLWRGPPCADLEFEPLGRVEVERLEELRLAALEERIEAELALGRRGDLVVLGVGETEGFAVGKIREVPCQRVVLLDDHRCRSLCGHAGETCQS